MRFRRRLGAFGCGLGLRPHQCVSAALRRRRRSSRNARAGAGRLTRPSSGSPRSANPSPQPHLHTRRSMHTPSHSMRSWREIASLASSHAGTVRCATRWWKRPAEKRRGVVGAATHEPGRGWGRQRFGSRPHRKRWSAPRAWPTPGSRAPDDAGRKRAAISTPARLRRQGPGCLASDLPPELPSESAVSHAAPTRAQGRPTASV
jgi:hypothetical protein